MARFSVALMANVWSSVNFRSFDGANCRTAWPLMRSRSRPLVR